MQSACDPQAVVCFYLSEGLVGICGIEISHMGKYNRNSDLVCKKYLCVAE